MWHSTEKMARAISQGLMQEGISVKMMDLKVNHRSDIITEILDAKAMLFGSPTLNNGMLPTMADVLTYLKGLRPKRKVGAAFGSFGWSGEAVKHINGFLEEMGTEIVDPGIKVKNVPTHEDYQKCFDLGVKVGQAVKAK
jgi:flavorubredoxin